MASTAMTSIRSARFDSDGRLRASAANAGSTVSSRRRARIAETNPSGRWSPRPAIRSSTIPSISRTAYSCAASQRLNASVSCAIRNASSSSLRSISTFTGPEKPRASDGTGREGTFEKRKVWRGSRTSTTASCSPARPDSAQWSGTSVPSSPSSARRSGTCRGRFLRLSGRRGGVLLDVEHVLQSRRIPGAPDAEHRGARLRVPAPELHEIQPRCGLHRRHEVLGGDRLAVVALEVQAHAGPEPLVAEQGVHHPDDLGALVVDRDGVEVVDFHIGVGTHGVRHRPRVLRELVGAQHPHVADALDRPRRHVGGELLVPEHRQPFLEAQLEPVAAGHAVAGPVVEVLVRDDRLDRREVPVGGGVGAGEHVGGVEDVEPLVLHRPHVEVVDRDDHEGVEVVLQAVDVLVPAHRAPERSHRVVAAVDVVGLHVDAECHGAARTRCERVLDAFETARDQGEEVARLRIGVLPHDVAAAVVQRAALDVVAVGEHHGVPLRIRDDPGAVPRHHVGTVEEPGDLPEPLRLALRGQVPRRRVEPFEGLVRAGPDGDLGVEHERVGRIAERQRFGRDLHAVPRHRLAVDAHRAGIEPVPVEDQVRGRRGGGIAPGP